MKLSDEETNRFEREKSAMEEATTARVKKAKKLVPFLKELPDSWVKRILDDLHGLDDVYELASANKCSKFIRKCLLVLMLIRSKTLGCTLCETIYSNHVHYLLHINSELHTEMMCSRSTVSAYIVWKEMLELFEDDIAIWKGADKEFGVGEQLNGGMDELLDNDQIEIRPTLRWLADEINWTEVFNQGELLDIDTVGIVAEMTYFVKRSLIEHLVTHIQEGLPVCMWCVEVFVSVDGFLQHFLSYRHVEMMDKSKREGALVTLKNLTMFINDNVLSQLYSQHMRAANMDNLESIDVCWENVKAIAGYLPSDVTPKTRGIDQVKAMNLVTEYGKILNGRSMHDLMEHKESENLQKLVEPSRFSFESLVRKVLTEKKDTKHPLQNIMNMKSEELATLYQVVCRTLNKGIPFCLYCNELFPDAMQYCNHLLKRSHHDRFSSYGFLADIHEIVQLLLLEMYKRNHFELTSRICPNPIDFLSALNPNYTHFYCDSCRRPFVHFSFYIAHFWSKSHFASIPDLKYAFLYITKMILFATEDQLSRIDNEVFDVHTSPQLLQFLPFIPENKGIYTRDVHLTYYVHFHYRKEYGEWRERQLYRRDEGRRAKYKSKRHAPDPLIVEKMDSIMRMRHKRAAYTWWDETSEESTLFRNFFSIFPPTEIWNSLNEFVQEEGKIPYCWICELEFRSADDYYLHFGQDVHPYPKGMDEPMAGLFMLVHIMYSERRVGVNLDEYDSIQDIPIPDIAHD
ncbi:hypothetical protein PENTCL1PPCAC_17481 [Pristionchus entomophagus]|uniref:C2H2-type domain-containing protein n=1 Tax=Pristionchus entomophagus TaxID=358040 RepID=A0AAV5TLU6_9BILA|nr:hypothetical protein PENTCL1PPCAC_17481 [Pristionchus entomophagus]